jgi:hypothetical protein
MIAEARAPATGQATPNFSNVARNRSVGSPMTLWKLPSMRSMIVAP